MKEKFKITEEEMKNSQSAFIEVPMSAIGRLEINPRSTGLVELNLISMIRDLLKTEVEKEKVTDERIKEYISLGKVPSELVDSESVLEVPIILGEIPGLDGLVVIDGYHRAKANELTGKSKIKAKVYRFTTIEDAREEAFRLNEAKGVSLNEVDIAYSLYTNYVARLKKDATVKLDPYVAKHCSKDVKRSKRLVYFAFFKLDILGEDFTEIPVGHTIYENMMSILRAKDYGYLNVPFEFKQQIRDMIEELDDKGMFTVINVRKIRDRQKKLIEEGIEHDLVDIVNDIIKDMGTRQITEEEQKLAEETEEMLSNQRNADEVLNGNVDNGTTEACVDIPPKREIIPPAENEEEKVVIKENPYSQSKQYNSEDNEESVDQANAYIISVLTIAKAVPTSITPAIKEKLRDLIYNIQAVLEI